MSIEETKIIYYNFPDTNSNFEKELLQKQIILNMYPYDFSCLSSKTFSTLNVLAIVIIIFIGFDDLTNFKKICMIIHLCIKWDSFVKIYPIEERASMVLIGLLFCIVFTKICQKVSISKILPIYG